MKIDRLFSELVYLMNRDVVTAREMAEHFEVSVRTVQRDMDTLSLASIPLLSLRGSQGGYGIMKEYKLDRQLMNTHDLFFILTSLESISSTLSNKEMNTTLEKMRTLVRDYQQTEITSQKEKFHIDFSAFSPGKNSSIFSLLQQGIETNTLVEFGYTNNNLEYTSRTVEPMTILFKWFSWYLLGFCRLKNDFRLFRLSRMEDVRLLDKYFERRNIRVSQFIQNLDETAGEHGLGITLKFHPSSRGYIEDYFKDNSPFDLDSDGYILVHLNMPESEWLYGMILSYGDMVEVLEPPHLRKIILEKSLQISKKYQK